MAQMTNYLQTALLNAVLRNLAYTPPVTVYIALSTTATTDAGGITEATGGSYARQACASAAPTGTPSKTLNSSALSYTNMPAGTIVDVAVYDALTAGNMLLHGALLASKTVAAGENFSIAAGDFSVTFN